MAFTASSAAAHYEKAYAAGMKQGGTPAVLTDVLAADNVSYPAHYPLGVIQIPLEQVAGTYTKSRSDSFSSGFYDGRRLRVCRQMESSVPGTS